MLTILKRRRDIDAKSAIVDQTQLSQIDEAALVLLSLLQGALLHPQDVADGVELELLAELLADALLHEFVPVQIGERSGCGNIVFNELFLSSCEGGNLITLKR